MSGNRRRRRARGAELAPGAFGEGFSNGATYAVRRRAARTCRGRLGFAGCAILIACASASPSAKRAPAELSEPSASAGEAPRKPAPRGSAVVREAEQLLARGDAAGARGKFEQALGADPRDLRALLGLGLAYEALEDPKRAEHAYRQAIAIEPEFAEAHNNLGLLLRDREQSEAAIRELELAARDPQLVSAQANLALALEDAGRDEQAARAYAKAVELAPKDAMLRANHGLFLLARGRADAAASELRAGLEPARGDRAALLALGNGLRRAGKPDEAVRALRGAIEAGSGKPTPALLSELSLAQIAAGDDAGARASLSEALLLDPRYATGHYLLGSIEATAGNAEAAKSHYERCLALEPRGPLAAKTKEKLAALKQAKR